MSLPATKRLSDLPLGVKGKVSRITASGHLKKRILEMGLTNGTEVQIKGIAPLGDPLDVLVKGYHLSLRKAEASLILVEGADAASGIGRRDRRGN